MMYLTILPATAVWCGTGYAAFKVLDNNLKSISGGKSYLTSDCRDKMILWGPLSFPMFTWPVLHNVRSQL